MNYIKDILSKIRLKLKANKVPVFLQMQVVECGTACLVMILNYYGKKISINECRKFCDAGRDGISALSLVKAGRKLGFTVRAFTLTEFSNFQHLQLPAIAHWGFNHFVIIESFSPSKIVIVDPGEGRKNITAEEFSKYFTGIIITFLPDKDFTTSSKSDDRFWFQYFKKLSKNKELKYLFAQTLTASFFLLVIGLVSPLFTKLVIDYISPGIPKGLINNIGLGLILIVFSQAILSFLRSRSLIHLRGKMDVYIAFDFFQHLLNLPFRFFQLRSNGDLLMRLSSVNIIRETLTTQTISILLDSSLVIAYFIILVFLSPQTAGLVLLLGLIQVIALIVTHQKNWNLAKGELMARAEEQGYLTEALKSIMIIKATSSEENALERWKYMFYNQLNISIKRSALVSKLDTLIVSIRFLSPIMLLWFSAWYILEGQLSIGTALALASLGTSTLTPVTSLFSSAQQLQTIFAHLDRLKDVLEEEQEVIFPESVSKKLSGTIKIENLCFRYSQEANLVLTDINMSIKSGQKVALVGATASGKSTLISLLLGLYRQNSGEILFDGMSSNVINPKSLRKQIGVVLQDSYLFNGSIRENISMGDYTVSLECLIKAATIASIHDEILQMPMQYETILGEGGQSLSGGQRQRIALARALVRNPSILILDEATSHLDVETESKVDKNLTTLQCTRIVIAHRLSTIYNSDIIFVMKKGTIVESGTHSSLVARKGVYSAFIKQQVDQK